MKNQHYISGRGRVCNFYIRIQHKTILKLFHFLQLKHQMSVLIIKLLVNELSASNEVGSGQTLQLPHMLKKILSPLLHILLSSSKFQEARWKRKKPEDMKICSLACGSRFWHLLSSLLTEHGHLGKSEDR